MRVGDYEIDIIVQGYNGKSVCHGGLGWSTLALIRGKDRIIVIDTGPFSYRGLIREGLKKRGLSTSDVTHLVLTHCHYDHSVNWVMFQNAQIFIGADEMNWARKLEWGTNAVPEFYVAELDKWPKVTFLKDRDEIFPGFTAYLAPGHTPGCLVFVLEGREHDVIFTGDAAKNRAELISRDTDMTYDKSISKASIEMMWAHWRKKPGTIVIPGHDTPMVLKDGKPSYIGKLEAAVKQWTGEDMETTTLYKLVM